MFLCVEPDGAVEPKILDFGISKMTGPTLTKLTTDGTLLGTPGYMSPEQTRGDPVDARSDVFAMAILLYEMISGVNPFYGTSYNAVIAAILERDPEPLAQVSPEVWKVIDKAFSKKRNSRHASAMDFANALRNAAGFAGRGSSPMVDVASLGGTSSERAGRVASARRPISETPTQAASFLPDHWRLRLVAAGVTVAILGTAAVVMLRTSGSEAGRDHVEAPTTGAVGAVNANGTTATAPGPTASASVRAMDIPPAPPASVVGSPVPAGSIVLPPPLPSPDTAAPPSRQDSARDDSRIAATGAWSRRRNGRWNGACARCRPAADSHAGTHAAASRQPTADSAAGSGAVRAHANELRNLKSLR